MDEGYEVYCGLDVGNSGHHAAALNAIGERVFDKAVAVGRVATARAFHRPATARPGAGDRGSAHTIGAPPIAVPRDCGCTVAYLPGLAMHKAADLHPGKSKTNWRDAFIIVETARATPHTLGAVDRESEVLAALKVLSGCDADLTHECTGEINRLRSLLLQIFPALALELFIKYSGPTGLRAAGGAMCCAGPGTTAGKTR